MKIIRKFIKNTYQKVLQSIAFYPVLLSLAFFILAIVGLRIENSEVIENIKEEIPFLFIQDYETARSILSTLIGGILSLTVFSFTMVMVVLNQASSDFSPRLLPGLISNKRHQIILGIYIGTLLYCIIILISLGAYGIDSKALGLSTMIAALSGVVCIGLFVYFIHSISGAILIHNIIDRIFDASNDYLEDELKKQAEMKVGLKYASTDDWQTISCNETGYFRGFDISLLSNSLKNEKNQIAVLPYINQHLWKGMPLLKVMAPISDNDHENLIFCVHISPDRHEGEKGIGGMIKLMEIAVKAMSPGINDPGTAIDAITKLGRLLRKFVQFSPVTSERVREGELILIRNNIGAGELMRIIIQPIRFYAKEDVLVLYELIEALRYVENSPNIPGESREIVREELKILLGDVEYNIKNEADKQRLLSVFKL